MAKATAICVCKHCGKEFEVSTIKMNRKLADSWEQWASTAYDCCYECEEKIRAEENARCAEEAKEMGLPALNGSQKQVAWAEKIRMDMMKDMESAFKMYMERIDKRKEEGKDPAKAIRNAKMCDVVRKYILENYTSASWWIDSRKEHAINLINEVYTKKKPEFDIIIDTAPTDSVMADETLSDEKSVMPKDASIVVMPEQPTKDVARVYVDSRDNLRAAYPAKDDKFREICKAYSMRWDADARAWTRALNEFTGNADDRQADLVNRLLRNGFPVQCATQAIADKATAAEFEPEHTRWIKINPENKLVWEPQSRDEFYTALKIPGSHGKEYYRRDEKYGKITVAVHLHAAVEEYAELYGYKLSSGSKKAIADFEAGLTGVQTVSTVAAPQKPAQPNPSEKLHEILESSSDVLPDLEDSNEVND